MLHHRAAPPGYLPKLNNITYDITCVRIRELSALNTLNNYTFYHLTQR